MWLLLIGCLSTDGDGDGFPLGYDCDDADAAVGAGTFWYADYDEDGFGGYDQTTACTRPQINAVGWVDKGGDCDDGRGWIHPAADEYCNDVDEDCDGRIDEEPRNPKQWYYDGDRDTYGVSDETLERCEHPGAPYVGTGGDCDDADPYISPGDDESCDDVDNDCDDAVDEGCESGSTGSTGSTDTFEEGVLRGDDANARLGASMVVWPLEDRDVLIVASSEYSESVSGLYQVEGPLSGEQLLAPESVWLESSEAIARGDSLTVGELNGDGSLALAVSARCRVGGAGGVQVIDAAGVVVQLYTACEEHTYETVLAPGDVDGDGVGELLVGFDDDDAPSSWAGGAWILSGPFTASRPMEDAGVWVSSPVEDERLGGVLAGGDLDGDGLAEIVLGSPFGGVYVLDGIPEVSGPLADYAAVFEGEDYTLTSAALVGDFSGDGAGELALFSAAFPDFSTGWVIDLLIVDAPLSEGASLDGARLTVSHKSLNLSHEASLVSGEGYRDGDLLLGLPGYNTNGAVFVLPGDASGALALDALERLATGDEVEGLFGRTLALGDLSEGGADELLIGAPGTHSGTGNSGAIFWYAEGD